MCRLTLHSHDHILGPISIRALACLLLMRMTRRLNAVSMQLLSAENFKTEEYVDLTLDEWKKIKALCRAIQPNAQ
jgi:hypothetical protein